MRNKIVMITAALAVMMALTGIAAAVGPEINSPDPLELVDDQIDSNAYKTIQAGFDFEGTSSSKAMCIAASDTTNINTKVNDLAFSTDAINWYNYLQYTVTGTGLQYQTIYVKEDSGTSNVGAQYYIQNGIDTGSCDIDATFQLKRFTIAGVVIPEFATVAIPIAAVLGLVFIFQQRKNKKE